MSKIVAFLVGIAFALGLGISGMTRPSKVLGFLELGRDWDPTLAFVMLGGIPTYGLAYWFIRKRRSPILAEKFDVPAAATVDRRLIAGATIFGIGWGLGGYCPGPGLVSAATGSAGPVIFSLTMIASMAVYGARRKAKSPA